MQFIGLKKVAAVLVLLVGGISLPPESEQYRQTILADKKLKPVELLSRYQHYDFSALWLKTGKTGMQNADESVLGFIGNDYQRLRIKLLMVRPDPQQSGRYLVTGKSKVKESILPFQGVFRLLHVREAVALPYGLDGAPVPAVKSGILLAEYELREPVDQLNSGVFRGILRTNWYLDRKGKMQYDNIEFGYSDRFNNNQFVGIWQSYKTKSIKRCNWGDWRIPDGRRLDAKRMYDSALDVGAGDFHPDSLYLTKGWQSYQDARLLPVDLTEAEKRAKQKAQKTEFAEWWK